jgi:SAM-dependent methyltransferase
MHQVLTTRWMAPKPGQRLLDVGSNTCWASAMFAERGVETVALDIATTELQGLTTADLWFEDKGVYFERVLGVMFDPSLASESFDYIWCCEVLHHNHRANLDRTLRELYRLLRPGGRLLMVNEPVRALRSLKLRPGQEVAEYEGHEHAYTRWSYRRAVESAGFGVTLIPPWFHQVFSHDPFVIEEQMRIRDAFQTAAMQALRRWPPAREAALAWKNYISGTAVCLVGTKPGGAA